MSETERFLRGLPSPELPVFLQLRALKSCHMRAVGEIPTLAQRCVPLGCGHPIPAYLGLAELCCRW